MNITISQKHQKIITPPHGGVDSLFGACPVLPDGNRLIPHGMHETLVLRHFGFKVPNPMELYYDWAGAKKRGKAPFAVQISTCKMLTENPRAYVLNHMGTGKTKTALWAWDYLNRQGLAKKLLVVAPLSTLTFVWAREIFETLPQRKVQVLHGSKQVRLDRLAIDADIYIINHDGLKVIASELQARADVDTLVLDELAVYRNNSERSKAMRKFAVRFNIVWGMTGSPMPNEPTDVWAQCKIVTPSSVPNYRTHARDALMVQASPHVWRPKPDAVERAFGWMQPSCRYRLDDVVELPPLVQRWQDVALSTEQMATYKRVASAMSAMVKDKQIVAANAAVAMGKLLQIAGGWVYTQRPEFVRIDPTPRILALADIIQSAEHKVIVAIPYRHMIEGISKILNMKDVGIEHCVVHGKTPTPDRDKIFNQFQNTDKYPVMLVHPETIKHGLTLTAADTTIWYLPTASLDMYEQLNARITRVGQAHKQQIIHLQGTVVERKLYKLLADKQKTQGSFLALVEEATDGI